MMRIATSSTIQDHEDEDFKAPDSDLESSSKGLALGDEKEYVMHNNEVSVKFFLVFLSLIFFPSSLPCFH